MNARLEQRVKKMEGLQQTEGVRVIFICPMVADNGKPATMQPEITGVRDTKEGDCLPRHPGELLDAFRQRATEWAMQRNPGVSLLVQTSADDLPAHGEEATR